MKLKVCPACVELNWACWERAMPLKQGPSISFLERWKEERREAFTLMLRGKGVSYFDLVKWKVISWGHKGWVQIRVSWARPFSLLVPLWFCLTIGAGGDVHIGLTLWVCEGWSKSSHRCVLSILSICGCNVWRAQWASWHVLFCQGLNFRAGVVSTLAGKTGGLQVQKRLPEHKVPAEKMLVCLLLCMIGWFLCSPICTSPCWFVVCGKGLSLSPQSSSCLHSFSPGGLQPSLLQAAAFALTGCPGAQVSVGKTERAARQVSCWFPCSSFFLLAEENLIFFFLVIIMGCEEQLLN